MHAHDLNMYVHFFLYMIFLRIVLIDNELFEFKMISIFKHVHRRLLVMRNRD